MINTIDDLKKVVSDLWLKFDNIDSEYLSDAGKAAEEAYRNVSWYLCFHETMESLSEDEDFMNIVNISGKHPEYYKVIRRINRAIERIIKE